MSFDQYLETRMEELRHHMKAYAKARAMVVYLEEFKKSKLAILMKKYEKDHKTAAAQEREARADTEYLELLDGLLKATEEAEQWRWELKLTEMSLEAWRTKQANMRVERKQYGA